MVSPISKLRQLCSTGFIFVEHAAMFNKKEN